MRRLLSARALGLAAIAAVVMAAMVVLGLWQFGVYDDQQRADAAAVLRQRPVPLDRVLGPDSAFPDDGVGRPVRVAGRYLADSQMYVRRMPELRQKYAVVTPLLTASGSAVLVVRGSSDRLDVPPPAGSVRVSGVLEPSSGGGRAPDGRGVTSRLSVASLVGSVRPDLYSGYVLLRDSTPAQQPPLARVSAPRPDPSRWAGIRNLLYACQWWVFAAFVAFMWWRISADMIAGNDAGEPPRDGRSADEESASGTLPAAR